MGRRYFIPNGTSSMPVFQFFWEMAWAVPLLLKMLGVAPGPAAQSWALLMSAAGQPCLLGLWWIQGTKHPKGLVSLKAASEAVFASQNCSAGWDYKACEQYGKAKEQIIVLMFVFLETRSVVQGTICCCLLVLCPTWSSKKASACWSDPPSSALQIGATCLWLKQCKLKVGLNCLLLD